jgi:hypothetical protein
MTALQDIFVLDTMLLELLSSRPKTGNFHEINSAIQNIFNTSTSSGVTKTLETVLPKQNTSQDENTNKTVEIHNGTWAAGLAAQAKTRLIQKQFNVGTIGNSINRPQAKSAIYIVGNKANLDEVKRLHEEFDIPVEKTLPNGEFYANTTDILLILGEDFAL